MNLAVALKIASFSSEDYLQTWEIMHISCTVTMISRIKNLTYTVRWNPWVLTFRIHPSAQGGRCPPPPAPQTQALPGGRCPALRALHLRCAWGKLNHFFFKFCCSTADLHCCVNTCCAAKWFIHIHILYISIYRQMCKYIFFCFDLS